MRHIKPVIIILILIVLTTNCEKKNDSVEEPHFQNHELNGLWISSINDTSFANLIIKNDRLILLTPDFGLMGELDSLLMDNQLNANLDYFEISDYQPNQNLNTPHEAIYLPNITSITYSGEVSDNGDTIFFVVNISNSTSLKLEFSRNNLYSNSSNLHGIWSSSDGKKHITYNSQQLTLESYDVSANGDAECLFSGDIKLIDENLNLFSLDLVYTICGNISNGNGYGWTHENNPGDLVLVVIRNDGTISFQTFFALT